MTCEEREIVIYLGEKKMKQPLFDRKKVIVAAAVFSALALPVATTQFAGINADLLATAQAAEEGGRKGPGAGSGAGKAGSQKGVAGERKGIDRLLRAPAAEEDSDRPPWAGVKGGKSGGGGKPIGAGIKKGDLYGDMYVLLRDANGVPILTADGLVQVIAYVYDSSGNLVPLKDASGNLIVIPYSDEGEFATKVTLGGVTYDVYPAEVELGRLSVGRSPSKVLDHALSEALAKLRGATSIVVDATGRLVVDGATIDSPLENLALYDVYMTTGAIPGVTLPANFNPAALLAAAADKAGTIIVDTVIYMNSILGVNTSETYYDFSTYEYDRYTVWKDAVVTVLVKQPDGSYVPTPVSIYEAVFRSTNWVDPTATGGADDFAAAANDYLQVIEFVHDNALR